MPQGCAAPLVQRRTVDGATFIKRAKALFVHVQLFHQRFNHIGAVVWTPGSLGNHLQSGIFKFFSFSNPPVICFPALCRSKADLVVFHPFGKIRQRIIYPVNFCMGVIQTMTNSKVPVPVSMNRQSKPLSGMENSAFPALL